MAQLAKVTRVRVTDQGSQFSRSRTAVIGTPIAAEKARNAGPKVSTHHCMKALSQGVIGTTHSAGYSISQPAVSFSASRARVARIRAAQIQSMRRVASRRRNLRGFSITAPLRRLRVGAAALVLLVGKRADDAGRGHHADRGAIAHH